MGMAICDLGRRGHGYEGRCVVQIVNRFRKQTSRRVLSGAGGTGSAIEPVSGHIAKANTGWNVINRAAVLAMSRM